jgi:hypothetical protein
VTGPEATPRHQPEIDQRKFQLHDQVDTLWARHLRRFPRRRVPAIPRSRQGLAQNSFQNGPAAGGAVQPPLQRVSLTCALVQLASAPSFPPGHRRPRPTP